MQKYKARMVSIGFTQQPSIDFNETFVPVACMDTVKTILAIATHNKWHVHKMDVFVPEIVSSLQRDKPTQSQIFNQAN